MKLSSGMRRITFGVLCCVVNFSVPVRAVEDTARKGLAYQAIPVEPSKDAAFLAGRVVNEKGQPIVGATVDAFQWFPGSETKTDATGAFRLANTDPKQAYLEAGETIDVTFSAPGYTPRYIADQALGQLKQPVVLNQKTFLEGTVKSADGKPVANAKVRAVAGPFEVNWGIISEVPYVTRSDAKGHFKLFLPGDTYELFVLSDKGVSRTPKLTIAPDTRVEKNFVVQPGATFRARVVDSLTGKPVSGFRLRSRADFSAQSGEKGLIEIPNMYSGPFEWDVEAKGIMRWWSEEATREHQHKNGESGGKGFQRNFDNLDFAIKPDMAPVTIVAERGVHIRGHVFDPSGKPVAGATVAPAHTGTGNSLTGDTRFSYVTNAKGEYDGFFPAGHNVQWNLIAHDGEYGEWRRFANATSAPFPTQAGQVIENFDLTLNVPTTVSGHVVDKAGKAVVGAEVRAVQSDYRGNRYYDPTTKTDAKGNFALRFVAPGSHLVQVEPFWLYAKEAPEASTKAIEVEAGTPVSDVQLTQIPHR